MRKFFKKLDLSSGLRKSKNDSAGGAKPGGPGQQGGKLDSTDTNMGSMASNCSKRPSENEGAMEPQSIHPAARGGGITAGNVKQLKKDRALPLDAKPTGKADYGTIITALEHLLLFGKLSKEVQTTVVSEMYEKPVRAGEILIKEGDTGSAARDLFVVKGGTFEVLQMRNGVQMAVNHKKAGDVFGEISLMYDCPRNATVAATSDAVVWVLERDTFRHYVRENQQSATSQIEIFLNSVPVLKPLSTEEKLRLVDALEEISYSPGTQVITQGESGSLFYIIKEGEAAVHENSPEGPKQVNHLFKADFFGEKALLTDDVRAATVTALTDLVCLTLTRQTFVEILGPLQDLMAREKSEEVVQQRMANLHNKGRSSQAPAKVVIRRPMKYTRKLQDELVEAKGRLDEVQALTGSTQSNAELLIEEGRILGGGAFSRVAIATVTSTGRVFALKCMRKSGVVHCPQHVYCEQIITKNTAHPFCLRQYASFQDEMHLYFLFDLMNGGDLMDILVAEAKVIEKRMPASSMQPKSLAPKVKMLKGMEEDLAKFYVGSLVLALSYLHGQKIVYRDLKPENVFLDDRGYIKLGDFGFAKNLDNGQRTYTFCGTPGYVAPENVLAHGYNYSVDWWGLGVLMYVLLTGRQPFSSPKTDDPMVVMRRIVDDNWPIKFPPYVSEEAQDLVLRLLERKPSKRIGMLSGLAQDIKDHKWFQGLDWEALEARRMQSPRLPMNDSAKRIDDLDNAQGTQQPPRETPEEIAECQAVFADF